MQINWENFHSPRISNLAVRVMSWLRWYNKNWSCDWSPDIKIYSSSLEKKKTGKKGREKLAFMFWSKSFSWLNIRNIITCMKLYDFKIFRKIAKNAINGCFEGLSTFLSHWEDFWFHKWCLRCDKCHVKLFVITFWILIQWRYFPWGFIFTIFVMFSRYAKKEKKIDFNTKLFSRKDVFFEDYWFFSISWFENLSVCWFRTPMQLF